MSDTPRTDAAPWTFMETGYHPNVQRWVKIEFARELERENAALREDKERLDSIKHGWRFSCEEGSVGYPDNWFIWTEDWSKPLGSGPDIRAAIDTARKEAQP